MSEPSTTGGKGRGHLAPSTEAVRHGSGKGDAAVEKILRPGADDRWRPLDGGGVELVDRWGNPVGWCWVPKDRLKAGGAGKE